MSCKKQINCVDPTSEAGLVAEVNRQENRLGDRVERVSFGPAIKSADS
ncbi:MAG: hypothetical protein K0R67_65, partial [Paenibacillus sp.]|nr:hypothetical protein [Paenibacillus sp.]